MPVIASKKVKGEFVVYVTVHCYDEEGTKKCIASEHELRILNNIQAVIVTEGEIMDAEYKFI